MKKQNLLKIYQLLNIIGSICENDYSDDKCNNCPLANTEKNGKKTCACIRWQVAHDVAMGYAVIDND